jgi:hypothetical protein
VANLLKLLAARAVAVPAFLAVPQSADKFMILREKLSVIEL